MTTKSIVLLSGGLDSCVALAIARTESNVLYALSFDYGQRHFRELKSAQVISSHYSLPHTVVGVVQLSNIIRQATALLNTDEVLPAARTIKEMSHDIPRSYVPGRNTIMLSIGQSVAEALGADRIYTGFNAVDYSGYPDCRPEYVEAINQMFRFATKRGVQGSPIVVHTPIISLSKVDIVRRGVDLAAPLHLTWSCYAGGQRPCGLCDSCIIRYSAFSACGMADPIGAYEVTPNVETATA